MRKLSETLTIHPVAPNVCQSCGYTADRSELFRWIECDESDQPTAVVVTLCAKCVASVVEDHPRLYRPIHPNEPIPGTLALCVTCRHRSGNRCGHPSAKANGGPGVMLQVGGRKTSEVEYAGAPREVVTWYTSPPAACRQREEISGIPSG